MMGLTPRPEELAPFTVEFTQPFADVELRHWEPTPYAGVDYTLPLNPSHAANAEVLRGLTAAQISFLARNGFVVIHSQEEQFSDIRDSVSTYYGQPYFLTTDAAFHALHLTFDEMLKALEREQLRPEMIAIARAVLEEVLAYQPVVGGTGIETDARDAVAYLSVALRLLDPEAVIDPAVEDLVSQQIDQIMAEGGRADSVLFPEFEDDYGAYRPVGHYAGDPELEGYFRGMTWFGRVHFALHPDNPDGVRPSRLPLIITLALRRGEMGNETAAEAWARVHEVLTFLIGPSDDAGPIELAALMDEVYGLEIGAADLADEDLWREFLSRAGELPAPQINSTFVDWLYQLEAVAGWRFMGQRFTIDAFILQNLVFDRVGARPDGGLRLLPSGLDVLAAFGSAPALDALQAGGTTQYSGYLDQMAALREAIQAQPEEQWLARFYEAWLYAFFPLLDANGSAYPSYMRSPAWHYREVSSVLGSWAELKHDTVLYTKIPEAAGGGGPPSSPPAPGYVEPNPEAFYRMAYAAEAIARGLEARGMDASTVASRGDYTGHSVTLYETVWAMADLGERLLTLGEYAENELRGQPRTDEEAYYIIQACLGLEECQVERERSYGQEAEMEPAPIVAVVAGGGSQLDEVLEVATGYVDRIYVVVPIEGQMQVAQGGVYSYFEFTQPRSDRLTDEAWRERLAGPDAPSLPAWASNFVLVGGEPTDWLAFHVGDELYLTEEGAGLNVRAEASASAEILVQLENAWLSIVDGPVQADGYTWWRVQAWSWEDNVEVQGWVVENQDWFARWP
jgi:hypothetical protein